MIKLDEKQMTGMYSEMKAALPILQEDRDSWVRKMMQWHFSEDTGSEFWLQKAKHFNFNPLTEVTCYEDIKKFGLFDKEEFKSVPFDDLVPKGFKNQICRIFETGGSTGEPIRIPDVTTGDHNLIMYQCMLKARGLPEGDILAMTPSGPHAYGSFVLKLGSSWKSKVFFIDFDPRWVKLMIQNSESPDSYIQHLIDQTLQLLKRVRPVYLFTTSKLLLKLIQFTDLPLEEYGIKAICTGGTSCSKEEAKYLYQNIFKDKIQWIDTYGNTLMGHALQYDRDADINGRSYYLPPPLGFIEVVNFSDWTKSVAIGERGRVLLITLMEDLFLPNLLERDTAIKVTGCDWFPWEGVSDVGIFQDEKEVVIEGVY